MPQYNNAPAFQLYAGDLLADPMIRRLTPQELGGYFLLLMNLWINGGSLDFELDNIKGILRIKSQEKFNLFFRKLKDKFIIRDNIITCPMLNEQIQKQMNYRLRASEYGHKGAKKRWGTPLTNNGIPYSNLQAPNSIIYKNNFSHHSSEGNTDGHTASTANTTDTRDAGILPAGTTQYDRDANNTRTERGQDARDTALGRSASPQHCGPGKTKVFWMGPPEDDPYRQCHENE